MHQLSVSKQPCQCAVAPDHAVGAALGRWHMHHKPRLARHMQCFITLQPRLNSLKCKLADITQSLTVTLSDLTHGALLCLWCRVMLEQPATRRHEHCARLVLPTLGGSQSTVVRTVCKPFQLARFGTLHGAQVGFSIVSCTADL